MAKEILISFGIVYGIIFAVIGFCCLFLIPGFSLFLQICLMGAFGYELFQYRKLIEKEQEHLG